MKKLIVFGDSWPYGAELDNTKNAFPYVMGGLMNVDVDNRSVQGSSIDESVLNFLKMFDTEDVVQSTILFCLTSPGRTMLVRGEDIVRLTPTADELESVTYYSHLYTTDLAQFNLTRNLILLQTVCNALEIPIYFVFNWDDAPTHRLLDASKIYNKTLIEVLGFNHGANFWEDIRGSDLIAKDGRGCHPSEIGHRRIATELSEWIKNGR